MKNFVNIYIQKLLFEYVGEGKIPKGTISEEKAHEVDTFKITIRLYQTI